MIIFDTFCLFNELDLLEFRLKLLSPHVDYFVISESNFTHSGQPKTYNYLDNISRYEQWKDKIIYIPLEQDVEGFTFNKVDRYSPQDGSWLLENQQRMGLAYANDNINDDSIVLLSDLDEIPNPELLEKIKKLGSNNPIFDDPKSLKMLFHYYYMNCQNEGFERYWSGTIVCRGNTFKQIGPQILRDRRNNYNSIPDGGWHFSFLNGIDAIKKKIKSFAHTEFNREDILSDEHIVKCLEEGHDIFNRPGVHYKFYPLSFYPKYLSDLMLEYPNFIKNI